jgi:quaternary ammonium compound-resistance protein SugE
MSWIHLFLAGLFEIAFVLGLRHTEGFTRPGPTLFTALAATMSLWLLTRALQDIPLGTAYAIWTGIGAVGIALVGMTLFGESASPARIACLAIIVAGVAGLKLLSR